MSKELELGMKWVGLMSEDPAKWLRAAGLVSSLILLLVVAMKYQPRCCDTPGRMPHICI